MVSTPKTNIQGELLEQNNTIFQSNFKQPIIINKLKAVKCMYTLYIFGSLITMTNAIQITINNDINLDDSLIYTICLSSVSFLLTSTLYLMILRKKQFNLTLHFILNNLLFYCFNEMSYTFDIIRNDWNFAINLVGIIAFYQTYQQDQKLTNICLAFYGFYINFRLNFTVKEINYFQLTLGVLSFLILIILNCSNNENVMDSVIQQFSQQQLEPKINTFSNQNNIKNKNSNQNYQQSSSKLKGHNQSLQLNNIGMTSKQQYSPTKTKNYNINSIFGQPEEDKLNQDNQFSNVQAINNSNQSQLPNSMNNILNYINLDDASIKESNILQSQILDIIPKGCCVINQNLQVIYNNSQILNILQVDCSNQILQNLYNCSINNDISVAMSRGRSSLHNSKMSNSLFPQSPKSLNSFTKNQKSKLKKINQRQYVKLLKTNIDLQQLKIKKKKSLQFTIKQIFDNLTSQNNNNNNQKSLNNQGIKSLEEEDKKEESDKQNGGYESEQQSEANKYYQDQILFHFKLDNVTFQLSICFCSLIYQNDLKNHLGQRILQNEFGLIIVIEDYNILNQRIVTNEVQQYKLKMLASFSHEMRTPLNCSLNLLQIFKDQVNKSQQETYIDPVINSSKILLNTINDILDFSQIEAGTYQVKEHRFNLKTMLYECTNLFRNSALTKGLQLEFIYDINSPEIAFQDSQRVQQVVINLLSNAFKYTQDGKISLTTQLIQNKLDQSQENRKKIIIKIIDTGQGISKEMQSQIFTLFSNSQKKFKLKFNSLCAGFGLTIANLIAKSLNDDKGLQVVSEIGIGSTFIFEIPIEGTHNYELQNQLTILSRKILHTNKFFDDDIFLEEEKELFGTANQIDMNNQSSLDKLKRKKTSTLSLRRSYFERRSLTNELFLDKNMVSQNYIQSAQISSNKDIEFVKNQEQSDIQVDCENISIDNQHPTYSEINQMSVNACSMYRRQVVLKQTTESSSKLSQQKTCDCIKVLLVDDNEFNLIALSLLLKKLQISSDLASSGKKAILLIQNRINSEKCCKHYQLIFMDLDMPIMDGYETTKNIIQFYKQENIQSFQPSIVACTAFVGEEEKNKCKKVGMDNFINKPVDQESVQQCIDLYVQ